MADYSGLKDEDSIQNFLYAALVVGSLVASTNP